MKRLPFAWLALGIGLLIAIVLERSGATDPDTENALPLLTLLILNEFGFIVTAIGAGLGVRTLLKQGVNLAMIIVVTACALLAAGFLWLGVGLWPGSVAG